MGSRGFNGLWTKWVLHSPMSCFKNKSQVKANLVKRAKEKWAFTPLVRPQYRETIVHATVNSFDEVVSGREIVIRHDLDPEIKKEAREELIGVLPFWIIPLLQFILPMILEWLWEYFSKERAVQKESGRK